MKIIRLLLQNSGKNLFIAARSSFISGTSSAGVIAVINYAIANLLLGYYGYLLVFVWFYGFSALLVGC